MVEEVVSTSTTTPQLVSAIVAANMPRSCIKHWMLDSRCGRELVPVEPAARLMPHVTNDSPMLTNRAARELLKSAKRSAQ